MRAAIIFGLRYIFHRALIECCLALASFAGNFSENVGLTLSRHCKERIVCGFFTSPAQVIVVDMIIVSGNMARSDVLHQMDPTALSSPSGSEVGSAAHPTTAYYTPLRPNVDLYAPTPEKKEAVRRRSAFLAP